MEVTGNGFLYRMVRMLAAGLVEVGHRRLTPAGLRELLQRADRSALPEAAPPHGLYLARVHYSGDTVFESRIQSLAQRMRESAGSRLSETCESAALTTETASPWLSEQQGKGQLATGGQVIAFDDEAEEVVRELRLTQGQKAAVLMRSAAIERQQHRCTAGEAGDELNPSIEVKGISDRPELGVSGGGLDVAASRPQQGPPAGRLAGGWEPEELTQLRDMDREDDQ
ncbi:hypothetical protein Vafri_1700 [Volvox africanus]|nr:hypothetical protein Vafri_1700 [Volvox africanus]